MVHVHLIGIGGSGMSAIARVLLESGYRVSGSDRQYSAVMEQLQALGATVVLGHRAENIAGADLVVRSSAIPEDNPEVVAAVERGIPVLKRAEFIGRLMKDKTGIAIAGTHGKTTTTAMIAWMLTRLGEDPSFIVGGVSTNLATNAHAGKGDVFVIEADEYDRMFLGLNPDIAVVTNIEHDHPDCFPTPEDFYRAFVEFSRQIPEQGILLACRDDAGALRLLEESSGLARSKLSYGFSEGNIPEITAFTGRNLERNEAGGSTFEAWREDSRLARLNLNIPGEHNARNALAALAVGDLLELPLAEAAQALGEYAGTGRRFEVRGEVVGITVIDDYAHHPTEIAATLDAVRWRFPGRTLWAVWQPHTYTRTLALFPGFTTAFSEADHVLVTEVFGAREEARQDFSAARFVEKMGHPSVRFFSTLDEAAAFLAERLKPGDVLVVLSAGDADRISSQVLETLRTMEDNG